MEKQFQRSTDKKILGVCGGLGKYFDIAPSMVRAVFLAGLIALGLGFVVYVLLALVMAKP